MAGKWPLRADEMLDVAGGSYWSADARGVLVVDPDPNLITVLQLPLQKAGFRVRTAGTAEEALRALREGSVGAVVMDSCLLTGPGNALTRRLAPGASKGRTGVALVIMSTLEDRDAMRTCGLTCDRFLAKPFDPWDLVGILRELLQQA